MNDDDINNINNMLQKAALAASKLLDALSDIQKVENPLLFYISLEITKEAYSLYQKIEFLETLIADPISQ